MRLISFKNNTGETIPAHGVVQLGGATAKPNKLIQLAAAKPDGSILAGYVINGPVAVPDGKTGHGTTEEFAWVAYGGSISAGDEIGPVEDSWLAEIGGSGYLVRLVESEKGRALCQRVYAAPAEGNPLCRNKFFFRPVGLITDGTFDFSIVINSVDESFTSVDWDITAADMQTLLRTHSEVDGAGWLECLYGPLSVRDILVVIGGAGTHAPPLINSAGLTGETGCKITSGVLSV